MGEERENLLSKIEEISGGKAHTNTHKLIWNILMVTDLFLNQKIVYVCEHMANFSYFVLSVLWYFPFHVVSFQTLWHSADMSQVGVASFSLFLTIF